VDRIAGFEIVRILGEGGMGIVYLARDETLQRELAVKVLRRELVGDEGRQRFIREARACSRISHPNIVTVYAAGEHEGDLYIAMELLEGRTLREVIAQEGPIEWRRVSGWMTAILSALQRLHDDGIIHRDLKPENIMVAPDGGVKLMDFGIAHVASESRITVDVSMLGTAQYMSPEQATGMTTDARSDIFSIGTILYESLSGNNPFNAPHPMAVMYSIANDRHESLGGDDSEIPTELAAIVDKALEKDPEARFVSAGEFACELSALTEGSGEGAATIRQIPLWRRLVIPVTGLAVIAAILTWTLSRGPGKGDRETADRHNKIGLQHLDAENIAGAQVEFRNAIISDPGWEIPWNNLAMIELDEGDFNEADSLLSEALRRNPEYAEAHYNMGTVRLEKGDEEGAETHLRAAIEDDPSLIPAYNNLGRLLIDMDRPVEAAAVLDDGLSRFDSTLYTDDYKAYLLKNRGIAAAEMGDASAETWWRKSLEIIPDNEEVRRLLESVGAL
jgi:Tfp pilus assembly protein PilF/tRNA A-37 threonylcarbamoyl transferase component Bud32